MLIAVDHGNKQIKTNHKVFTSGIRESDVYPKFAGDVLKYGDKYYTLSGTRIPFNRDKTKEPRFYILTLFAIAYELQATALNSVVEIDSIQKQDNDIIGVQLLVGLPPAHYSALYEEFERFFTRRGMEAFEFNGKKYEIYINEAIAFPQAYAAAQTRHREIERYPKSYVIDLGGWTLDYITLKYGDTDWDAFDSLEGGVIKLYNKVASRINADFDILIDELDIDTILRDEPIEFDKRIKNVVLSTAQEFTGDLISQLREREIDLRASKASFVGGGSILLKNQIMCTGKAGQPIFIEDIRANVIGYELLYASMAGDPDAGQK